MISTEDHVYIFLLCTMAGYIVVATLVHLVRRHVPKFPNPPARESITLVFDAATFAGSALLALGIFFPQVLVLIGTTKPFLIVASLAGLAYSVKSLFPPS